MGGCYAVLQYVIVFIAEQPVEDRIKDSGRGYVLTIPSDSLKVALSKVYHLGGGTKSLGVSRQRVNNRRRTVSLCSKIHRVLLLRLCRPSQCSSL